MNVAIVVDMEAREVLDAVGEKAKAVLKGEHQGGREVEIRFDDHGKVTGAKVTFNGKVSK